MDWFDDTMNYQLPFFTETDQYDLLLQQSCPSPCQQQLDMLPRSTTLLTPPIFNLPQNTNMNFNHPEGNKHTDPMKMKISRREHEKKRREEMVGNYASLRSLLPLEYIKGKRSASDHILQSVGYIKELQTTIQKLTKKRDEVKQILPYKGKESDVGYNQSNVTIQPSMAGVDVLINTSIEGGVKLSKVLNILIIKGLSIISCNSVQVNGRLLHNIQTEVNGGGTIDPVELHQMLND
ncbi:basic helix-loop-helix transcription factor [Lithospermum erythrorhizon]|uniref:Basic helix-loop-helix transcription factor n=1 Tax=Lithospermum erythrorhizon TaxID=34254 RepID=A0AAV3RP99_LITER